MHGHLPSNVSMDRPRFQRRSAAWPAETPTRWSGDTNDPGEGCFHRGGFSQQSALRPSDIQNSSHNAKHRESQGCSGFEMFKANAQIGQHMGPGPSQKEPLLFGDSQFWQGFPNSRMAVGLQSLVVWDWSGCRKCKKTCVACCGEILHPGLDQSAPSKP